MPSFCPVNIGRATPQLSYSTVLFVAVILRIVVVALWQKLSTSHWPSIRPTIDRHYSSWYYERLTDRLDLVGWPFPVDWLSSVLWCCKCKLKFLDVWFSNIEISKMTNLLSPQEATTDRASHTAMAVKLSRWFFICHSSCPTSFGWVEIAMQ